MRVTLEQDAQVKASHTRKMFRAAAVMAGPAGFNLGMKQKPVAAPDAAAPDVSGLLAAIGKGKGTGAL